uniref:Protein ANTAGONIST OF LIKE HETEROCHROMATIN PROTEIN 1-like n=1 Tax=Diabrotica virgifera virgifera TaxID=50390 RepID=A0A6P7GNG8_DIAVI
MDNRRTTSQCFMKTKVLRLPQTNANYSQRIRDGKFAVEFLTEFVKNFILKRIYSRHTRMCLVLRRVGDNEKQRILLSDLNSSQKCIYTSSGEEEALVMLAMEDDNSRKRRKWVHDINLERLKCGEYHTLMPQLRKDDKRCYIYFRMTIDCFDELLHLVENDIRKSDTNYREAISPEERLAITLRYLATGDTFYTIGHSFRVGFSTVSAIVVEVCEALCRNLQHIYLPEPTTEIWKKSEEGFRNTWRFPNCIGSIDGKHVTIKCPDKTGSNYWCYLNKFSTVLMAIVGRVFRFQGSTTIDAKSSVV